MKRLCVFCGSSPGADPVYREAATALGHALAEAGIGLVYGGASVGLMGAVADAVLSRGGEVIGVIPRLLVGFEVEHTGLADLRVVDTMHERKAMMADLADGFIALPGGIGTLEELFEVWTWGQLGAHGKPCGLLDVAGYYRGLRGFIDHMVEEGFLRPPHRSMLVVETSAESLLHRFRAYAPPPVVQVLTTAEM
ncbi:MAG: TIGR00730 family Rossman fold protein [Alphaproteobacteria bacterium]